MFLLAGRGRGQIFGRGVNVGRGGLSVQGNIRGRGMVQMVGAPQETAASEGILELELDLQYRV